MLRLGLGVAIGWFAYEALQKKGESFPGMVKSCVAKAVEVFKKENDSPSQRSPLLSTSEEGKQECVK